MSSVRYLAKRVERRMRRILARGEAIRRERLALMTRRPVESVATVSAEPAQLGEDGALQAEGGK